MVGWKQWVVFSCQRQICWREAGCVVAVSATTCSPYCMLDIRRARATPPTAQDRYALQAQLAGRPKGQTSRRCAWVLLAAVSATFAYLAFPMHPTHWRERPANRSDCMAAKDYVIMCQQCLTPKVFSDHACFKDDYRPGVQQM